MSLCPVGITADDLTGAADAASALARPGAPIAVFLHPRVEAGAGSSAFAVTTDSRACPPEEAYRRVRASVDALRKAGAALIYKKIDSNLRGNVGAEIAAVREALGAPLLLAPAFPARGRTTAAGVVLVNGTPVAETEMARDPEAPVSHSDLIKLLRSQRPDLPISHCPLTVVRAGPNAIQRALRAEEVVALDAETDADLDAIAEAALSLSPQPALAGSAGLAAAVGRRLFGPPARVRWPPACRGPILGILASSSKGFLSQVAAVEGQPEVALISFPCDALSREEQPVPELNKAINRAAYELAAGRTALVYAVGPLPKVERPIDLVVEHLAHLAFVVLKRASPRGLLVGGGSTAQAVLAALEAETIQVDDDPLPGIAAGLTVGGHFDARPVVLKPGAAGGAGAIVELLSYLGCRAAALEETQ